MRRPWLACLFVATLLPLSAEDWTTQDGHTYRNVTVVTQEEDGVRITYLGGVGKILYYELPVEIQKRFGQDVDSIAAKKSAMQKTVADAVRAAATSPVLQPVSSPATPVAPNKLSPGAHPIAAVALASKPIVAAKTPASPTPQPATGTTAEAKPLALSAASYSYNPSLDVCYLDSPPVEVYPASQARPGQKSSFTLRMVSDGRTPQQSERCEATFLIVGGDGGDLTTRAIAFNTDTGLVQIGDGNRKDSGSVPGGALSVQYASFYLSAAQLRQICDGKSVTFSVGPTLYRIDERGAQILRNYVADIGSLEPAASPAMRGIERLLARLPSFFSMISTACEYLIVGSFALLVAASIAAFVLGVARFIKM